MKKQQKSLIRTKAELQALQNSIKSSIGETKYGEAVSYVDTLLDRNDDEEEMEKLALVKSCLMKGDDTRLYVPNNLDTNKNEEAFILQNFGGVNTTVNKSISVKKYYHTSTRNIHTAMRVQVAANKFILGGKRSSGNASTKNFRSIKMRHKPSSNVAPSVDCLPEFMDLDVSQQRKLFQLLSWTELKKWDFNIFEVAAIDQDNTLLFVSWAVICSPYAQIAMARQLQLVGDEEEKISDMLDPKLMDGYDFFDLGFAIDSDKLCNYIRAIQGDYRDVPYHNRVHAADVVQSINSLIQMTDASIAFQKEDLVRMCGA